MAAASMVDKPEDETDWSAHQETQQPQPVPPVVVSPPPEPITPQSVEPEPAQAAYRPEETEPPIAPSTRVLPPEAETEAFRPLETEAAPVIVSSLVSQPEEVQP